MATELNIPEHLWGERDAAISSFLAGKPDVDAEKSLEDWLLSYAAYDELADGDDPIAMLCDLTHTDLDIRDQLGLEQTDTITDAVRVQYALEMIQSVREDSSATYIDARLLTDSKGRSLYIGLSSFAAGQGGMQWEYLGLYESPECLIESFLDKGVAVDSLLQDGKTLSDYSEEELLRLMQKAV